MNQMYFKLRNSNTIYSVLGNNDALEQIVKSLFVNDDWVFQFGYPVDFNYPPFPTE